MKGIEVSVCTLTVGSVVRNTLLADHRRDIGERRVDVDEAVLGRLTLKHLAGEMHVVVLLIHRDL